MYTKLPLSGSTGGRAVSVVATGSPGTTIHTGSTSTSVTDEVWLYAVNSSASDVKLTVEWGGSGGAADLIEVTVPAESGLIPVAPGLLVVGAATAMVVRAFAGTASVVNIHGYVNRIS